MSEKWPVHVIFYFMDMALGNLWLLYREHEILQGNKKLLDLLSFRDEVGYPLLLSSTLRPPRNAVGRPRLSDDGFQMEFL